MRRSLGLHHCLSFGVWTWVCPLRLRICVVWSQNSSIVGGLVFRLDLEVTIRVKARLVGREGVAE